MKTFSFLFKCTPIFVFLLLCCGGFSQQFAPDQPPYWNRGSYKLLDPVETQGIDVTGPSQQFWWDITVWGTDIYGAAIGDQVNGAGQVGFVLNSGRFGPLNGPGPMNQPADTATIPGSTWVIPNEGRFHNPAPGNGYNLAINLYDQNPADVPNQFPAIALVDNQVFVDVEIDLVATGLDFAAGNYKGGDFLTITASWMNGRPDTLPPGLADPTTSPRLETRPLSPGLLYQVDFRLTIDPIYDTPGNIRDDFAIHSIIVSGDGRNGQ
ncbi:MAG: hypothetical protein VXB01_13635, partial [Opitutae bacterium]